MKPENLIRQCQQTGDFTPLVEQIPYAAYLGIELVKKDKDILFCLHAKESNIGNLKIRALHGGAIAGFMEHSAIISVLIAQKELKIPKVINFSIDYLRSGKEQDTFAECKITRLGGRVANVQVNSWQVEPENIIATARVQFLLSSVAKMND